MRKVLLITPILWIAVLLLSACQPKGNTQSTRENGDTLQLKYAEYLHIIRYKDYTKVVLTNPWNKDKLLGTYLLTDRNKPRPAHLPQEGKVIQIPLQHSLVYSAVHCSLMEELGVLDALGGVCDLPYIAIPAIQQRYQDGLLIHAGSSMNPDMEKVIEMSPDAILLSPYEGSAGYGRIEKLHIPIVECADYMESSALGRAEWIRFFGLLFGKEQQADRLFQGIEKEYLKLKASALQTATRPTVISELKMGNTWYVAGGNSTTAKLFADAGADYLFSHLPQSGSVPMSFESVFDRGQQADFWLIKYNQQHDKTYRELQQEFAPYAEFQAFKQKNIYGCNTRVVRFYEESPFHPERVLENLIHIFHPEVATTKTYTRYFTPLSD